ncbi:sodium-extruding oxaloacetate decarboxylase subunit alpha [Thiocapsa sp.]|uniref:sodium-extruding oxaloacetate decarboxylase subunit alpha n=1 Tax=Thiocapsa sp. TaxID=2024551 RepID=UPI002BB73D52|nr:sodium-extruding oxaloacetate decarboxylase subunit alpha [Thiocapsa sp.]HSO82146.1 sodium-extruding oxaloacetate decarboxylase subunit alpha [Thiocapsa sp.]
MKPSNRLAITDVVLRDAHQSLLATRLRIEDMLPIAPKLDEVGYWSIESWGGATFDACIRYLGEDPWERLRLIKAAMPKTPQQMLLRGQNLLGYRHYADDLVETFVERAALNGIDVFRIFDAMNDVRNLETSVKAALATGKHAQGTMSYTVSPVHDLDYWVDMGRRLEDMGCHSICIKDMAGLLKPYVAETLVTRLKETCSVPIAMQSHATTGMSTSTILKAAEAGIDMVDTAISSMSMTYGHSPTESVVAILEDTDRSTGLNLFLLEEIAAYFREVRKKYAKFEGALKGVDSRILVAQVPGGMLTNMESQLREQGATDRFDAVLAEIPRVREDLGFLPLVTPTSQIVGSQAVLNVLMGERYKSITNETAGVLKGEYGATPAPVNVELQQRVLAAGEAPITCRPADNLTPELDALAAELQRLAEERSIRLASDVVDDVLTYALFPQVGLKFLAHRGDPSVFEPPPWTESVGQTVVETAPSAVAVTAVAERYRVEVDGHSYHVVVSPEGVIEQVAGVPSVALPSPVAGRGVPAPLAGTVVAVKVKPGQVIASGELIMLLEAMKMETEVRSPEAGTVLAVSVKEGDSLQVGQILLTLG